MDEERERVLFTVSGEVLAAARKKILGCEHCSDDAQIPFNVLLDQLMLFSGAHTDYILTEPMHCPWCGKDITEETPLDWE